MARPIETTPTLYGKDADEFVRKMFEPPTKKQKEFEKRSWKHLRITILL